VAHSGPLFLLGPPNSAIFARIFVAGNNYYQARGSHARMRRPQKSNSSLSRGGHDRSRVFLPEAPTCKGISTPKLFFVLLYFGQTTDINRVKTQIRLGFNVPRVQRL
jgi:hypothetical protein